VSTSLKPRAMALLQELEKNNNREWYEAHRAEMKAELLEPVADILEAASKALARTAVPLQGGKKTLFRMHRDTRFSANKLPYKIHVGGMLTIDGSKRMDQGLGYLHCEPGGSFVAAGFHMPETKFLEPVRQHMLDDAAAWRRVLRALDKAGLTIDDSSRLKSMPRGFSSASAHEHAESLKLKSLTVSRKLANSDWTKGLAVDALAGIVRDAGPLLRFVREAH